MEPKYTKEALAAHLEGTVIFSLIFGPNGAPSDIYVLKSLGMGLDENAKDCVLKWRFSPAPKTVNQ